MGISKGEVVQIFFLLGSSEVYTLNEDTAPGPVAARRRLVHTE